jgi:hypothetical protein
MLATSTIVLGSIVNFSQYAPAIIGQGYVGATVLAILDWESAQAYINPATVHASVYPSLPGGTPNDFTAYPYLKIKTASGQTTAVGFPWIIDSSYQVQTAAKLTIVVDSVSPSDQNNIKAALSALGFTNATITITSSAPTG